VDLIDGISSFLKEQLQMAGLELAPHLPIPLGEVSGQETQKKVDPYQKVRDAYIM